jgi:peptidoglycan/LPS O-acetylase OafA/YrhL
MDSSKDTELGIDALRGLAALAVLFSHTVVVVLRTHLGTEPSDYEKGWQQVHHAWGLGFGVFWVWVFFVISGFCIHQSIKRSRKKGSFSVTSYGLARITRIYPLFLIGLGITLLGWWLTQGWNTQTALPWAEAAGCLAMLQIWTGTPLGFQASWSLTNEMIYYAAWPLALATAGWSFRRALTRSVLWSLLQIIVFAILWKTLTGGATEHWLIPFWTLPALYLLWLAGAWLAEHITLAKRCYLWAWLLSVLAMLALLVVLMQLYAAESRHWLHFVTAYAAILPIMGALAGLHHLGLSQRPLLAATARYLGSLSYPCYILHHPLLWSLQYLLMANLKLSIWQNISLLCLTVAAVVGTLGVWLEQRTLQWRKSWLTA